MFIRKSHFVTHKLKIMALKVKKMDPVLIAGNQRYELSTICKAVKDSEGKKLKVADLKEVMESVASQRKNYKPGDLARSRSQVYAELVKMGYTVPEKKKKAKK
jgi:hypothetical protein